MALLSAAFLAGLALIAVPIWMHRLRAHSAEQKAFSSLFLMRSSQSPVNMQRRLQHLLLLALRIILLVLLCLAFAEPLFERDGSTTLATVESDLIVVIDNSLSMGATQNARTTLEQAKARARDLVAALPSGSRAAIISAAQDVDVLTSLTDDRVQLDAAIASINQSSGRLSYDGLSGRVSTAASALVDPGRTLELHILSDFQRSAMPDQFNALVANATFPTTLHRVGDGVPNWSIQSMHLYEGELAAEQGRVQVVVASHSDEGRAVSVALHRANKLVASQEVVVAADRLQSVTFPVDLDSREPRIWRASLDVDDALLEDNERYLAKPETVDEMLPVLTGNQRAYTYVSAAVRAALPGYIPTMTQQVQAAQAPVIALVDPGQLSTELSSKLEAYLQGGGAVLLTVGDATRAAGSIALLDVAFDASRISQDSRGVVATDRTHPVLSDYAGWQEIKVFQSLRLAPPVAGQVILSLDDGSPLLLEHRVGAGRLLVLTTSLSPEWSSLVVEPAFVSFVANVINYLAEDLLPSTAVVGQPFAIPTQSVQLFDSAGSRVLGLSDTVDRPAVRLPNPGIYEIRTASRSQSLAVNIDVRESALEPADADMLQAWQDATKKAGNREQPESAINGAATAGAAIELNASQQWPLAPWLLLALLVVVCIECVTANIFTRRARGVAA